MTTTEPAPAQPEGPHALPTVVIGGYLGAGKTTLVNHLLREARGERIAVLVNDFGAVAIDAELIVGAYRDVLALAGGCVCCAYGADLIGALQRALRFEPRPERVLIECSGVALPAAVARSARLAAGIAVEAIVVLADAATLVERGADRYVGDTVRRQLAEADVLILNHCDAAGANAREHARSALARWAPGVPVLTTTRADVAPALLLGWRHEPQSLPDDLASGSSLMRRAQRAHDARDEFSSETCALDGAVDPEALAAALAGGGVLRAKGIVRGLDGRAWLVQTMGQRVECTPWPGGAPSAIGRLVVIRARRGRDA